MTYAGRLLRMGYSRSKALTFAWAKIKLVTKLREQPMTCFEFIKKSTGESTQRMGTLNKDYFTYEYKLPYMYKRWYIVKFWDISKLAFRSLDIRTLVAIHW